MSQGLIHQLIRSKRRTIALQMQPDATLVVRAPDNVPMRLIEKIVREKLDWIRHQQKRAIDSYRPSFKKTFISGESFSYLGESHALVLVKDHAKALSFDGKSFVLRERDVASAEKHFLAWYKKEAFDVCSERARFYAGLAGLEYRRISIRNSKTRWGSCGPQGNLNFNWRLILAPVHILDYVVVHEVMHLAEKNHSRKFWDKVQVYCPEYKAARRWLKVHHRELEI